MMNVNSSLQAADTKLDNRSSGANAAYEAILDAALKEFSIMGFKGTTVRNIGKRANVDFTLITYYFKTKENLWKAVITRGHEKHSEIVSQHMEGAKNLSPGAKLKARIRAELEFAYSEHSIFRLVMIDYSPDCSRGKWLMETYRSQKQKVVINLVKDAQASGEMPASDPIVLTNIIQVGLRSLLFLDQNQAALSNHKSLDEDTIEKVWEVLNATFFRDVSN
jgi:AcrR family transcriptional regulator